MYLKYIIIPGTLSNILLKRNSLSYLCWRYYINNRRLFCALNVVEKESVVEEFSEKGCDQLNKENLSRNEHNAFQKVLFKLYGYSQVSKNPSHSNVSIHNIEHNISHPLNICEDLSKFIHGQNCIPGLQVENETSNSGELNPLLEAKDKWMNGHIQAAFRMFSDMYHDKNSLLKEDIVRTLQALAVYSISTKGKAIVHDVIRGTKMFTQETNDSRLMVTVWYSLFTSEWFSDWCLAENMLNESPLYQQYLEQYISPIGLLFLKNNELNNYQRLIQTSLKFNMDKCVTSLLRSLFNYYYKTGYLDGCSAVYKCCRDIDIKLTQVQVYKYEMLKKSGSIPKINGLNITSTRDIKYKF